MSMTFYAVDDEGGEIEVAVDDPGHGYVHVRVIGGVLDGDTQVSGSRMAEMLSDVTAAALDGESPAWVRGIGRLSGAQCRALLPQLQKAIALAIVGTDRYERVFVNEEHGPLPQLCASCGEGSGFTDQVTISSRCVEFGHRPFGVGPDARWLS
jgi:hypothetical protein